MKKLLGRFSGKRSGKSRASSMAVPKSSKKPSATSTLLQELESVVPSSILTHDNLYEGDLYVSELSDFDRPRTKAKVFSPYEASALLKRINAAVKDLASLKPDEIKSLQGSNALFANLIRQINSLNALNSDSFLTDLSALLKTLAEQAKYFAWIKSDVFGESSAEGSKIHLLTCLRDMKVEVESLTGIVEDDRDSMLVLKKILDESASLIACLDFNVSAKGSAEEEKYASSAESLPLVEEKKFEGPTVSPVVELDKSDAFNKRVQYVDLSAWPGFFDSYFSSSFGSTVDKKRMIRIKKELSILEESLPDDIFVFVHEDRFDKMIVLITGPEGTPYEHGSFLFDLYLPPEFPALPPKMNLINNGHFRFNPNLYDTGYVCFSLLGTWSGPSWNPSASTLLQLFVSMQAMILCEKPYGNEPGMEHLRTSPEASFYEWNVHQAKFWYAIYDFLKDPTSSAYPEAVLALVKERLIKSKDSVLTCLEKVSSVDVPVYPGMFSGQLRLPGTLTELQTKLPMLFEPAPKAIAPEAAPEAAP